MIKIDRNDLAQALDTFTDAQFSDEELEKLHVQLSGPKDLLCHILLKTDFLSKYPEVSNILRGLSGPVSRSLLNSPDKATLSAKIVRTLRQELYEKQKLWAGKAQELNVIEWEIIQIRDKISAAQGVKKK